MIYGKIDGEDCTIIDDYVDGTSVAGRPLPMERLGESRTADILKGDTLVINDTSIAARTRSRNVRRCRRPASARTSVRCWSRMAGSSA